MHGTLTQLPTATLVDGNCLDLLRELPDGSIDLAMLDLPYQTTKMVWDKLIPWEPLWAELRRVLTPTGTAVAFGSQPFTTDLIMSARDLFSYACVWEKNRAADYLHAKNRVMKTHEDVIVFSKGVMAHEGKSLRRMTYNPQGLEDGGYRRNSGSNTTRHIKVRGAKSEANVCEARLKNYPRSVLYFPKDEEHYHPTQKPVALLTYLINTYSNPGDIILDPTMGSGSTGVAALGCGRNFVGFEPDPEFFEIAEKRIADCVRGTTATVDDVQEPHLDILPHPPVPATVADSHPTVPSIEGDTTLYNGDCLEVMRGMEAGSIDIAFTSPPYNLRNSSGGGMKTGGGIWESMKLKNGYASYSDDMPYPEYVEWQKQCLREMWRLLSDDGAIFYQHKARVQNGVLQHPLDLNPGLPLRQVVIWDRSSGMNFNRSFYTPSHELIMIYAKPKFRLKKAAAATDVWRVGPERNNDHPAPFPVQLVRRALETVEHKRVFDPFMGSGTTGVAALQLGKSFTGIELDRGYYDGAKRRLANTV